MGVPVWQLHPDHSPRYHSYPLTMMQDWFDALANARQLLRQGGQMALVDFYISRKYPARDRVRHGAISRAPSAERFGHYGLLATMYCRAPIICLI